MKKFFRISLAFLLIIVAMALLLNGCQSGENFTKNDFAYLVIGTDTPTEYKISLKGLPCDMSALDLMEAAKEQYELEYKATDGFLTEVGDLKNDSASGTYIFIYTSVEKDFDVSAYAMTLTYNEQTLTSSGVGATQMTILADCVIYIGTIVW